jgi:hypothetical protein
MKRVGLVSVVSSNYDFVDAADTYERAARAPRRPGTDRVQLARRILTSSSGRQKPICTES